MAKIKLSIKPLQEALERAHPCGASFLIAPLSGEREQELTAEHTDLNGVLHVYKYSLAVCLECIKGWKGVGDANGESACNPASITEFMKWHASTIVPWILRQARSLDHYRQQENEAAGNV